MHYIRFLRPPELESSDAASRALSLAVTVTTDLGDSFLQSDEPIELRVVAGASRRILAPVDPQAGLWRRGMRALKFKAQLPEELFRVGRESDGKISISVEPRPPVARQDLLLSLDETDHVLPWKVAQRGLQSHGLIMPAMAEISNGRVSPVCIRSFYISCGTGAGPQPLLELEEDIGENMARHVWDAGVVAASLLADGCRAEAGDGPIGRLVPRHGSEVNILELGCGVGILGLSLATLLPCAAAEKGNASPAANLLLTDLPEAQERARSNIARLRQTAVPGRFPGAHGVSVAYEDLDWETGARGAFGPMAASRSWDWVVLSDCTYNADALPSLVGTLTALHDLGRQNSASGRGTTTTTRVLLATKPRHDSEDVLFELLPAAGWKHWLLGSTRVPKLPDEEEIVQIYLLDRPLGPIGESV